MVLLTETHQFSLGQTTLDAVSEQVRRQLQGQRTYFLPEGGGAMGWERETRRRGSNGLGEGDKKGHEARTVVMLLYISYYNFITT